MTNIYIYFWTEVQKMFSSTLVFFNLCVIFLFMETNGGDSGNLQVIAKLALSKVNALWIHVQTSPQSFKYLLG